MSTTQISICNEALALLAKGEIQSLNDTSIEARECKRFFQPLLDEFGELIAWPEQRKRALLAQTTNDRPAEWNFAYIQPSDMTDPIAIRQPQDAVTDLPLGVPYSLPYQDQTPIRFVAEEGKIYTNVEEAILVYSGPLTVDDMRPLTRRAFVDELAARLAVPVAKNAKAAEQWANKAEISRARAMADAMNRTQTIETRYASEAELARMGMLS